MKMYSFFKHVILLFVLLPGFAQLPAQERAGFECFNNNDKLEVGLLAGAIYYMGDFNPNLIPLKNPFPYGGVLARYNIFQYLSLRGNLAFAYITGNAEGMEGFPFDPWEKNWEFMRPMLFFDALAEFNFMPYNAVDIRKKQRFTPLLSLGVGASFLFPDVYAHAANSVKSNKSLFFLDIPVGIGAKWCFLERFTLGVEWMFRISFDDGIDFYDGVNEAHSPVINNDWIGTLGVSVSYLIKYNRSCPAYNRHTPSSRYLKKSRVRQSGY
ncbi:MAG: DUF6089 family protein [Prevotellaceae bacterium]|jgi:hypothetical protein|nr:DUF6089 family protein [Prevotellaceae bacterium]